MEHPKYHAHRNSLNLQHPQPRQGPTHRHQTYLESQAVNYENPPTPDQEDLWGSGATMALNRNRFSTGSASIPPALSPVYSDHSASEQTGAAAPARPPKVRDDGPLVPPKEPLDAAAATPTSAAPASFIPLETTRAYDRYSSQLAAGTMHVPSPLEPIAEVRYSLETDGVSVSGDNGATSHHARTSGASDAARAALTPSPHPAPTRAMRDSVRKITGPRDMPVTASPSVRRKPVQDMLDRRQSSEEQRGAPHRGAGAGAGAPKGNSPASGTFLTTGRETNAGC